MKANNGSGNIPERDLWETDQNLFNILNEQYKFTFDCCANIDNKKCMKFSDNIFNIKIKLNDDILWINPPFSKIKTITEHFIKIVKKGIMIYRCDNMETKVWQEILLKNADWIFIPKGRWNYNYFINSKRKYTGSRFPSALIGFNIKPPKNLIGTILYFKK